MGLGSNLHEPRLLPVPCPSSAIKDSERRFSPCLPGKRVRVFKCCQNTKNKNKYGPADLLGPSTNKQSSTRCGCQRGTTVSSTAAKAGAAREVKSYHPWFGACALEARDKGKSKPNTSTGKQEEDLI